MKRALVIIYLVFLVTNATDISILDATIKDKSIENVEVIFQKNGESSIKANSDSSGKVSISTPFNDDSSNVVMILKKDGYSTMAIKCPCDGFVYAMSPVLENLDSFRVVLSWDKDPYDMDLHLAYGNKHIFWDNKMQISDNAYLDVDDRDGYGPETITIQNRMDGEKYIFFVHDFTGYDKQKFNKIKNLKVYVYAGKSLLRTYNIPPNIGNNRIWIPFYIDEEGKIVDKNITTSDKNTETRYLDSIVKESLNLESAITISNNDKKMAKTLNAQGEKAYHEKKYNDALMFYNDSIFLNPNDGQTYSNLGLLYQKMGNHSEALWANRKAIDLASGSKANTIKASSYYNIARIYESEGDLQKALDNYTKALNNRNSKAYKDAIEKIKAKMK